MDKVRETQTQSQVTKIEFKHISHAKNNNNININNNIDDA
jgi:hypothetical protein